MFLMVLSIRGSWEQNLLANLLISKSNDLPLDEFIDWIHKSMAKKAIAQSGNYYRFYRVTSTSKLADDSLKS